MNTPKVRLTLDRFDIIIEILGALGVLLLIALPILHYNDLPESIPRHYGVDGEPDGFGQKNVIWTLPLVGIALYIGLSILTRHPHLFNYPNDITEENKVRQYTIGAKMVRMLKTIIIGSFAYIIYITIQNALYGKQGLGNYFLIIFLGLIFGAIGYFIFQSVKKQ